MNSFVRCLVMLTYTLVIYRLENGLVVGESISGTNIEVYITKEFCEKRVVKVKEDIKIFGELGKIYRDDADETLFYSKVGAMCVPSKDL